MNTGLAIVLIVVAFGAGFILSGTISPMVSNYTFNSTLTVTVSGSTATVIMNASSMLPAEITNMLNAQILGGKTIQLQYRSTSTDWTIFSSTKTDTTGKATFTISILPAGTIIRAVFAGTTVVNPSESEPVTI